MPAPLPPGAPAIAPGDILPRRPAAALAWEEFHAGTAVAAPEIFFWWSATPCVVVGLTQDAGRETRPAALATDGVALLRRQSGGGAVWLGPGVLCFSAFAPIAPAVASGTRPAAAVAGAGAPGDAPAGKLSLHGAYDFLTAPVRAALAAMAARPVGLDGTSDLTFHFSAAPACKCGGTAQLRRRGTAMVHGAILIDAEPAAFARYLPQPSAAPAYRAGRAHGDFCLSLSAAAGSAITPAAAAAVIAREATARGWLAAALPADPAAAPEVAALVARKYAREGWNWRRERG